MVKFLRWSAIGLGVFFLALLTAGYGFYRAATALPPEYAAALEVDQQQADAERQELESQLAALYSEAQQPASEETEEPWAASFTDDQINAWFATRLTHEMPEVAAQGVLEPRVLFAEEGLTIAFRLQQDRLNAVVLFRVTPFVTDDGRLGIELTESRVGAVPLPTGRIVELARPLLVEAGLPVEWSAVDDQPALLFEFEKLASDRHHRRTLTALHLKEGLLHVAGQSKRRSTRVASVLKPTNFEK